MLFRDLSAILTDNMDSWTATKFCIQRGRRGIYSWQLYRPQTSRRWCLYGRQVHFKMRESAAASSPVACPSCNVYSSHACLAPPNSLTSQTRMRRTASGGLSARLLSDLIPFRGHSQAINLRRWIHRMDRVTTEYDDGLLVASTVRHSRNKGSIVNK